MGEWWITETGLNMLKGVEGEAGNPPLLEDEDIIKFLREIPAAWASFQRLLGTMSTTEQARLNKLCEVGQFVIDNPKNLLDARQKAHNTAGVFTSGPKGGGGWSPPPFKES